MTDKLDIVGIGNAMVDAIIPSNKDEVEKNNLNRDSMNLIDEELKNSLHNNYSIKEMAGGGSLGNSMFGITSFGGNGSFIGKIKNDEVGIFLQKDIEKQIINTYINKVMPYGSHHNNTRPIWSV